MPQALSSTVSWLTVDEAGPEFSSNTNGPSPRGSMVSDRSSPADSRPLPISSPAALKTAHEVFANGTGPARRPSSNRSESAGPAGRDQHEVLAAKHHRSGGWSDALLRRRQTDRLDGLDVRVMEEYAFEPLGRKRLVQPDEGVPGRPPGLGVQANDRQKRNGDRDLSSQPPKHGEYSLVCRI